MDEKPPPRGKGRANTERLADRVLEAGAIRSEDWSSSARESEDAPPTLPPGTRFGRFEIVRLIGRGGVGEVYQALDTNLNRHVALKVLTRVGPQEIERFRREALLAARLDHPNIVQIHEIGEIDGRHYISMQYVDGDVIDRRPLNLKEILQAIRRIGLAVHYAHSKGIIHRDIKPSNILVDQDGRVFLTDFGTAKHAVPSEDPKKPPTSAIIGTPCYMSPEQARGDTHLMDARTDVYGLGATLYKLVTRVDPFVGSGPFDILQKVIDRDVVRPSRLNRALTREFDAVIQTAMEKERARRYPTALEFAEDLGRILDGEPVRASPVGFGYRILKRIRRNRAAFVLAAVLVVVVSVLVALVHAYRTESELAKRRQRAARFLSEGLKSTAHVVELSGRAPKERLVMWVRKAVEAYDRALQADPGDITPLVHKAETLYWYGELAEAERILERTSAMPVAENDYRVPFLLGRVKLRRFVEADPIPMYAWTALGPEFLLDRPLSAERSALRKQALSALLRAERLAAQQPDTDQEAGLCRLFCSGAIAYLRGRAGRGAEHIARALQGGLRGRDAEVLLGLCYFRDREFERAIDVWQGLLGIRYRPARVSRLLAAARLGLGVDRGLEGDPEASNDFRDVRARLGDLLREDPSDDAVRLELAEVLATIGRFREELGEDPGYYYAEAVRILGRLAEKGNEGIRARAQRDIGMVLTRTAVQEMYKAGQPLARFQEATRRFEAALKQRPGDPDTLALFGELNLVEGDYRMKIGGEPNERYQLALNRAWEALKVDPEHLLARDVRVRAYQRLARFFEAEEFTADVEDHLKNAEKEWRAAYDRSTGHAGLLLRRAELAWQRYRYLSRLVEERIPRLRRQLEDVLQWLERTLALNPYHRRALVLRALAMTEMGRLNDLVGEDPEPAWREARAAVNGALQNRAERVDALIAEARLNLTWGSYARRHHEPFMLQFEEAERALDRAADRAPGEAEIHFTRGVLAMIRNRWESARKEFLKCIAADQSWTVLANRHLVSLRRFLEGR